MACRIAWVCLAGLWIAGSLGAQVPQVAGTDDLALAAASLDRGEEAAAIAHLARYVAAHPDCPLVRFTLADLLWKRDQFAEAGVEYERFVHDTPTSGGNLGRLIQAHVCLVAVAEQRNDSYAEHLHRGIGLYLLAGQSTETASNPEGLLFKAAGELTLATHDRPTEARPHWYLYLAWSRLAQSQPAERRLQQAGALAAHSDLSPAERRDLAVANGADRLR